MEHSRGDLGAAEAHESSGSESDDEGGGLERSYSESSSEDGSEWSLPRTDSSDSFGSHGSLRDMGSDASLMSLGGHGARREAPWWMPRKAMALLLRDFFCQILDWVVAALLCLCWQLRPSVVSLCYGMMAAWMLVWKPQVPQLVNQSAAVGRMPFPRMLPIGVAVAASGLVVNVILRLLHGDEPPGGAVDWFG